MIKSITLLVGLLFPVAASAATLDQMGHNYDIWSYQFTAKNGLVGTPFYVNKLECHNDKTPKAVQLLGNPTVCFKTEAEARVAAQKDADQFEIDKTKNGESTTTIETKRLYYKAVQGINHSMHGGQ